MRYENAKKLADDFYYADTWLVGQADHYWHCFCQFDGPTVDMMPSQGIKLHLSCQPDLCEYIMFLDKIIPVLKEAGATFKVVQPSQFESWFSLANSRVGATRSLPKGVNS